MQMPGFPKNNRKVRRLGVVSDTHGHVENTRNAVRVLNRLDVDAVLHCGDIGSTAIPPLFAAWPTHYVFGNVDWGQQRLREAIASAGQTCHGRFGSLTLDQRKIAWLHSDDAGRFRDAIDSGQWDLVCYGHTHEAEHHFENSTLVLNPGAIHRAWPLTVAMVELARLEVTLINVE